MDIAIQMHNEMVRIHNENHQRFVEENERRMIMRNRRHSGSTRRVVRQHIVSKEEAKSFLVAMMKNRLPKSHTDKIKAMGLYSDFVDCYEWCCVEDTLSAQIERCQTFMDKVVRYVKGH
jgi:hypothetical protein